MTIVKAEPGQLSESKLKELMQEKESKILYTYSNTDVHLNETGDNLLWLPITETDLEKIDETILLGKDNNKNRFVRRSNEKKDFNFVNLRSLLERKNKMSDGEVSISGQAISATNWFHNNKYCGVCGNLNVKQECGAFLKCGSTSCKGMIYPRIDPIMITCVLNKERTHMLLGRRKEWPTNRFSCLAGFVEQGESVEETCVREVFEEAGVDVDPTSVKIVTTQPWPLGPGYSSQLMIGCTAVARSNEIKVNTQELEVAKWFDLQFVKEAIDYVEGKTSTKGELMIPNPWAIAFHLMKNNVSLLKSKL